MDNISSDEDDFQNPTSSKICETESDNVETKLKNLRLGKCEVCLEDAIYTCPKCEVKSCSLKCSNIHKKELNCNGIRDKTKYIPIKYMTEMDFMSDYKFLEECTRYVEDRKQDKIKQYTRYNKSLPTHLFLLRNAAKANKVHLKFLIRNFTKHKNNTTRYDFKSKVICWRIEWNFIQIENIKLISEQANENTLLGNLFNDCVAKNNKIVKDLDFYQSKGLGNLKFLLKSEGIPKCKNRYYELDCGETLKKNLCGKTIVEFPSIYVFYDDIEGFDIIDSDEDVDTAAKELYKSFEENYKKQMITQPNNENDPIVRDILKTSEELQKEIEKMEKEKELEARYQKREEFENKPKNFLVAEESYYEDEDMPSDGQETDEEKEQGECFNINDIQKL